MIETLCELAYGFEFVDIFEFKHFSALLSTTQIIFSLCTGNNTEKTHEHTRFHVEGNNKKNDPRCRQQRRSFSALLATMLKIFGVICNNAE
jgi:predicted HNH restriction endonuclease